MSNANEYQGIDVSRWNNVIDWAKVKAGGIDFAIMKATQGTNIIDSTFERNYAGAKSAGVKCGAYHFMTATTAEAAKAEADYFLSALKGKQFDYPVAIDVEDRSSTDKTLSWLSKSALTDVVIALAERVESAGYWVAIYTNTDWMMNKLDAARLKRFTHWRAHWYSNDAVAATPTRRATHTLYDNEKIWQYGIRNNIPGVTGNCDGNVSYYDFAADIKAFGLNGYTAKGTAIPTPAADMIKRYKATIQERVKYDNPDAVFALLEAHPYALDLFRKWADSYNA